jgi:hypothetical protein
VKHVTKSSIVMTAARTDVAIVVEFPFVIKKGVKHVR